VKALFVTTESADCENHVQAWNSAFPKAVVHKHNPTGIRNDWQIIEVAKKLRPDVIFYIGAVMGSGIPRPGTLFDLNQIAPLINFCSDAADQPWADAMALYKKHGCFTLQVAIDGADTADLATLTPVDPAPFGKRSKSILFGFSGSVGRWNTRSEVVNALEWLGGLEVRRRGGAYQDHVDFMCRTKFLFNTAWTGTGRRFHVKGRVVEAGYANCALIEHVDSPIGKWFPDGAWFQWSTPRDAVEIVKNISDAEIARSAKILNETVREKYTAKKIYQEILDGVDITESVKTA